MKIGYKVKVVYPNFLNKHLQLGSIGYVNRVAWDGWLEVLFDGVKINLLQKDVELIEVKA